MNQQSFSELLDFHRFVGEKVNTGENSLSPEEVLDEWRLVHPNLDAVQDDRTAIQEAISDIENGDTGMPFDDFDRGFRGRHNLPADT